MKTTCPNCKGSGLALPDDKEHFECPVCNGNGSVAVEPVYENQFVKLKLAEPVKLPINNLQDIAANLRRVADEIESEAYNDPARIVDCVLVLRGELLHIHAFGNNTFSESVVLLDCARLKLLETLSFM